MDEQGYIIRESKDSDLQGILNLWELHSGWGRPEAKEYETWMQTPYGECVVLVAEDNTEQIIGQVILTPTELVIYGKDQKALKVSAPIIHEDFRGSNVMNLESLMMQLFLKAYQVVQMMDYDWFYSFPALGWSKVMGLSHNFGLNRWGITFYDCYEIDDSTIEPSGFSLQVLDVFSDQIQNVWDKFKELNQDKSFVTRDINWLGYKWGDDLKIGIYNLSGKLDGYVVIKLNSGLILDFVMLSSKYIPVVISELKQLFDKLLKSRNISNTGLKFMQTEYFETHLKGVKVKQIDFKFVFALSALKSSDLLDNINLNNWYVFPND